MKRLITPVTSALLAQAPSAQTTGAAPILGTVTDTTGAVIPGVKVTVVSTETGFHFEGVTNNDGYYYIPYLRPGVYNVTIEAQGFKKYVRESIELRTNDQPRIDVKLEIGSMAESVEVVGSTPLLETETPVTGGVMESQTVLHIPILHH